MKAIEPSKREKSLRHPRVGYFANVFELHDYLISRKRMKVRVYDIEEAEALMKDMMERGYEGVQNDSYRYCRLSAERALIDDGRCYICNTTYSIYVASGHDPYRKHFLDVSKSKFIAELDRPN